MGDYIMSTIKANDIQNASGGIPTVKSQQLIPTAWVNFNGSSTVAIRDSENVSSITDEGTGKYTVNFAIAMANANYAPQWEIDNNLNQTWVQNLTTTTMQTRAYTGSSYQDINGAYVIVMGGQA